MRHAACRPRRHAPLWVLLGCLYLAGPTVVAAPVQILFNHIGYEPLAPKRALLRGDATSKPSSCKLIDAVSSKPVLSSAAVAKGPVQGWRDWVFWETDFSALEQAGTYFIECAVAEETVRSHSFVVRENLLERHTLSDVIYYFKGQRASGPLDQADRALPFQNGEPGRVDARGGWYDATGDYGKHLSHLNPSTYFNPQHIPLTVWSLLRTYQELQRRDDPDFRQYLKRLLDEGLHGADFLVRMKRPDGSFYESVVGPGPDKKPSDRRIGDPNWKTQIKKSPTDSTTRVTESADAHRRHPYEAGYRAGGGMAIAALALASTMKANGAFSARDYLRTAQDAFRFLEQHNRELLNDGTENIIDDYSALLAATALYRATGEQTYRSAADARAERLMNRLITNGKYRDYWRADERTRPFFHASDAGLPVVSLLDYHGIANDKRRGQVLDAVRRSLSFELAITREVNNPFGYARQLVRRGNGTVETAYFFPHDSEAAPWWQGENARLASLAAAARMAARLFATDRAFQSQLQAYAWDQLNWILGFNPFDASMLTGHGRNNVQYLFFNSYQYTNAPGGIVNGITSGLDDEQGIDLNRGYNETGADNDWRWAEQWLPHASWYLFAISLSGSGR